MGPNMVLLLYQVYRLIQYGGNTNVSPYLTLKQMELMTFTGNTSVNAGCLNKV